MNRPFQGTNLPPGGWRAEVHARLSELVARHGRSPGEPAPAGGPPVVAFDFDNTCVFNDIGELYSHFLIDEMLYRYDRAEFWDLIDPADGRDRLRALTSSLSVLEPVQRRQHPDFGEYLAEMGAVYLRKLRREGKAACYEWAVRLHVGLTPAQMQRYSRQAIARELARPVHIEERTAPGGDRTLIRRGIRMFREMRELIALLEAHGFEPWIVSASNAWTVAAFASLFGIPPARVLGNRVIMDAAGFLGDATLAPVLFGPGKVEALQRFVGRPHVAAFGDAQTDYDMLCEATGLAVLIDRGDAFLLQQAEARGWAVQPQQELTHDVSPSHLPESTALFEELAGPSSRPHAGKEGA